MVTPPDSSAASVGRLVRDRLRRPRHAEPQDGLASALSEVIGSDADDLSTTDVQTIAALFPEDHLDQLATDRPWRRLMNLVHPDAYWAQREVAAPQARDPRQAVIHALMDWLTFGARAGVRPSIFFHEQWYADQLAAAGHPPVADGTVGLADFVVRGWDLGVVPTPLFDPDFYAAAYPDVPSGSPVDAWRHFVMDGCRDSRKRPGPITTSRLVPARPQRQPIGRPVLLPAFVSGGRLVDAAPDTQVHATQRRTAVLESPQMQALVAKVAAVEPLVTLTPGAPTYTLPPQHHAFAELVQRAERLRRELPRAHADVVVLLGRGAPEPDDAATAAGADVLVVACDESAPRPTWLAADAAYVDLPAHVGDLPPVQQLQTLLDLVRGTTPTTVVVGDTALGWELVQTYGRQLSTWTLLVAVVPDAPRDRDERGRLVDRLEACFAHLSQVIVPTGDLRDRLVEAFSLPPSVAARIQVAGAGTDRGAR